MTALSIIYILSSESGIRYTLAYTNCMNYVIKLILNPHPNISPIQLVALAINLASNERNAEHLEVDDFKRILEKAIKLQDPTLLKFCKNILRNTKNNEFHDCIKPIIKDKMMKTVMTKSKNTEMCLEMLGIMANSKLGKDWTQILLSNDKFIDYLEKLMINGIEEDDILMEVLALVSNICQQAQSCTLI